MIPEASPKRVSLLTRVLVSAAGGPERDVRAGEAHSDHAPRAAGKARRGDHHRRQLRRGKIPAHARQEEVARRAGADTGLVRTLNVCLRPA